MRCTPSSAGVVRTRDGFSVQEYLLQRNICYGNVRVGKRVEPESYGFIRQAMMRTAVIFTGGYLLFATTNRSEFRVF